MANTGETVPQGFWFCCNCQQSNKIELAPERCSNCEHTRDASCKEAGSPRPTPMTTGRYTANPSSMDPVDSYPSVSQHKYSGFQHAMDDYPFNSLGSAGAPAPGFQHAMVDYPFNSLGSASAPASGFQYAMDDYPFNSLGPAGAPAPGFQHAMDDHPFNSLGPAGAPAPGSWMCECGASNSSLTPDFCPLCSRPKP